MNLDVQMLEFSALQFREVFTGRNARVLVNVAVITIE